MNETARKGVDQFLNSRAMVTPGVAGATATLITTTLVNQFGLPGNWVGLITSFLMAVTVLSDKEEKLLARLALYVINGFVIFSVAFGLNCAGMATDENVVSCQLRAIPEDAASVFRAWTW